MLYPWQQDDWRRLNAERERLPNAWLFTGPGGTGTRLHAYPAKAGGAPRYDSAELGILTLSCICNEV